MPRKQNLTNMNPHLGTFCLEGEIFSIADMPENVIRALATHGLEKLLARCRNRQKTYRDLIKGNVRVKKDAAPPESSWHRAAASVHAIAEMRALGLKPAPGKSLRDHPEYDASLQTALGSMAPWNRIKTVQAKKIPAIVEEHARIFGGGSDMKILFAAVIPNGEGEAP